MDALGKLSKGDAPTLALVRPTAQEKEMQLKLNAAEWRGALSVEAYLRREAWLARQALTKDDGISYWILVDTALANNPLDPASGTRLPLASCESYRKKALVWQQGKVQEVIAHGVGSVFCASRLRKRGYAQRMVQALGDRLTTHQTSEATACLFSVLYSDIGKEFYKQLGWEPFPSSHVSLPAAATATATRSACAGGTAWPTARPLYAEDLEALCSLDVAAVRRRLETRAQGSKTAVALLPDIDTIRWHHAREEFVGRELHGRAPTVKGAMASTDDGRRVWCYWTRMWYNPDAGEAKGNTMHILRLVVEDAGHGQADGRVDEGEAAAIGALLALAQHEAEAWTMERVELWAPSATAMAAARRLDASAAEVQRDVESIASLRWYPAHEGRTADQVEWVGIEKYAWC